jgi:hypothetical protein
MVTRHIATVKAFGVAVRYGAAIVRATQRDAEGFDGTCRAV